MRFNVPQGATPIDDLSGLIPEGILTYADLSAVEAENIFQAANKHLHRRKNLTRRGFTEDYVRKVHRDMFGSVWTWAGSYRQSNYNLGVPVELIRDEIQKLSDDQRYWDSSLANSMSILERAVRIHHRLAWIHPFPNGNGRHARMMMDIYLYAHRQPLTLWPSDKMSQDGNERAHYHAALKKADSGDFKDLIEFTKKYL